MKRRGHLCKHFEFRIHRSATFVVFRKTHRRILRLLICKIFGRGQRAGAPGLALVPWKKRSGQGEKTMYKEKNIYPSFPSEGENRTANSTATR